MIHERAMHILPPKKLHDIFVKEYEEYGDKFIYDMLDCITNTSLNEILWRLADKYKINELIRI